MGHPCSTSLIVGLLGVFFDVELFCLFCLSFRNRILPQLFFQRNLEEKAENESANCGCDQAGGEGKKKGENSKKMFVKAKFCHMKQA